MKKSNKLILFIVIIAVLGAAAFLGYPYWQKKQETRQSADQLTRLTTFKVQDTTIDPASVDAYLKAFNAKKDYFLAHQGEAESFYALIDMGQYKKAVRDFSGAEELWLYALEQAPYSYIAHGNLASLYQYDLQDYPKAEEHYLKALEPADVINSFLYFSGLYDLYHSKIQDQVKAEDIALQAVAKLPDDINVYLMAGRFYSEQNNIEKAREYFNKALEINPKSIVALSELEKLNSQN